MIPSDLCQDYSGHNKLLKLKKHENKNGCETAFEKKTGNCFTDAELKGSTNTYNDHYEGIVHWCKLNGVVHKRYVRLYLYESFQGVGKSVSLDEVFASDRTTVE